MLSSIGKCSLIIVWNLHKISIAVMIPSNTMNPVSIDEKNDYKIFPQL
jgi:hypothetical protein